MEQSGATPEERVVTNSVARMWLDSKGILWVSGLSGVHVTLVGARECISVTGELCGARRVPVLVDIRRIRSIDREARTYFSGAEASTVVAAQALLVGSPLSRIIGNFFMGLNEAPFPTRLFSSEQEAVGWLSQYL
jgi:hypothetical protein